MSDAEIVDRIAAIGLDVAGLEAVYGPGTELGQGLGVQEFPDDISVALPAMVVLLGPTPIINGFPGRTTWTLEGSVWAEYSPRGLRYRTLMEMRDPIDAAFRGKAKAGGFVEIVQITQFGAIEVRRWTAAEGGQPFLVQPFSLEARINRNQALTPS